MIACGSLTGTSGLRQFFQQFPCELVINCEAKLCCVNPDVSSFRCDATLFRPSVPTVPPQVARPRESMPERRREAALVSRRIPMQRILTWAALALVAMTAGCEQTTSQQTTSEWRFPCNYRAFDAGFCDNLNGLPNANYNLSGRLLGSN